MKFSTEVVRKVFDDDLGVHIAVAPDGDGLGLVEINGGDDFGGYIRLCPEMALLVADAIKATAGEMIKEST